jgi:bacteriocin leader peptide (microcyclamide/patellamide family)
MNKQNLMPLMTQPINRITAGQLPRELAELSEEALQLRAADGASVGPSIFNNCVACTCQCSYDDGDEAE